MDVFVRCFSRYFLSVVLLAFVIFYQSCSTIDKTAINQNLDLTAPNIRTFLLKGKTKDISDYKLRNKRLSKIVIGIHLFEEVENEADRKLNKVLQLILLQKLEKIGIQTNKISLEEWNAIQNKKIDSLYSKFKKQNLDAIVFAKLNIQDKNHKYELSLWDPVYATKITELNVALQIRSRKIDKEHQAEIFLKKNNYRFLNLSSNRIPVLPDNFQNELSSFVLKSVQGTLNVQASAANLQVRLTGGSKNIDLGSPPFSTMKLDEGLYSLVAKRKGYENQRFDFHIRSGKKTEHFISYPDTNSASTVAVLSAPQGQRVSVDGQVVGETPYFISGLSPGSYELEVSKKEEDSSEFYITAQSPLEINAGLSSQRLLLTSYETVFGSDFINEDFFTLSSKKGKVSLENEKPGLRFYAKGVPVGSWLGLVSRPLILNDFSATLSIEETPDQKISFGLVSGDSGNQKLQILVNLDNGLYSLLRYENKKLIAPLNSWTTKKKTDKNTNVNLHDLRFEFQKKEKILNVYIDGTKIFSKPEPELFVGNTARFVIFTRSNKKNGVLIAHKFRMYSGPGLSDEK